MEQGLEKRAPQSTREMEPDDRLEQALRLCDKGDWPGLAQHFEQIFQQEQEQSS